MRALPRKFGKAEHDLRFVLPNLFTAASLCAGMTALLFASEGKIELAVLCVLLAAVLDACDGRIARMTGATSRFGSELDSLADVVSFGAAPAFILYCWGLGQFGVSGWLPCLALGTCCALRLARFNVAALDTAAPAWSANYFAGIPAPAGAFLALAPILAEFSGFLGNVEASWLALFITPAIAGLMISTWPTFSGKLLEPFPIGLNQSDRVKRLANIYSGALPYRQSRATLAGGALGRKASRLMLLPPVAVAGLVALGLLRWPWATLLAMAALYVCTLPLSKWRHGVLGSRSLQGPRV